MNGTQNVKRADRVEWTGGDLAGRLGARRRALGLTVEEVAGRARMDAGFVELAEQRPLAMTAGALVRLADALDTTVSDLLGRPRRRPGGGPATTAVLVPIGPTECATLLARGGIGRVAVRDGAEVDVFPVNYTVVDDVIVFRTATPTVLARLADGAVTFEIDEVDPGLRTGWSVVVHGTARVLTEPELHRIEAAAHVEPWAGGHRDLYIALTPDRISGRRIRV